MLALNTKVKQLTLFTELHTYMKLTLKAERRAECKSADDHSLEILLYWGQIHLLTLYMREPKAINELLNFWYCIYIKLEVKIGHDLGCCALRGGKISSVTKTLSVLRILLEMECSHMKISKPIFKQKK